MGKWGFVVQRVCTEPSGSPGGPLVPASVFPRRTSDPRFRRHTNLSYSVSNTFPLGGAHFRGGTATGHLSGAGVAS